MNQVTKKLFCQMQKDIAALCGKIESIEINIPEVVAPPQIIIPPCQPCIAVDGVVSETAFVAIVDGVAQYFDITGPITGAVEVLDACDPRCACTTCDLPPEDCDCTPEDAPALAAAIGGLLN